MNLKNTLTEKITFSLEKGHRFFNNYESYYNFLVVQFYIQQNRLENEGQYHLVFSKDSHILFSYDITIHKDRKQVHSHNGLLFVDPLIESENLYNITFHFPTHILEKIKSIKDIQVQLLNNKKEELMGRFIENISFIFGDTEQIFSKNTWHSKIIEEDNKTCVLSDKSCTLTLHLGNDNKVYQEEDYSLLAHHKFDISKYIGKYSYLGVQCSFEDIEPEVEEKYILIGLNGLSITGSLHLSTGKIHPIFDYRPQFQQKYNLSDSNISFIEVFSIDDLLSHYRHYRHKPITFPCDYHFILNDYSKNSTYNQNQLYSSNSPPLHSHTISETCSDCSFKSECLQVVPSGLSKELFKRNIAISEHSECDIYQLIQQSKN